MRFLRKNEAADRVGFSQSHVMRLVREGDFPQPVPLGKNSVAFVEDEVEDWMRARVEERELPTAVRTSLAEAIR